MCSYLPRAWKGRKKSFDRSFLYFYFFFALTRQCRVGIAQNRPILLELGKLQQRVCMCMVVDWVFQGKWQETVFPTLTWDSYWGKEARLCVSQMEADTPVALPWRYVTKESKFFFAKIKDLRSKSRVCEKREAGKVPIYRVVYVYIGGILYLDDWQFHTVKLTQS